MPVETAEAVITQCRDFVSDPGSHFLLSSFEERLAQADFLTEEERKTYAEANQARVIGHVQMCIRDSFIAPRPYALPL